MKHDYVSLIEGRPRTEAVHRQILTLVSLALRVPREVADVQVYFSAHVGQINVDIHHGGYERNKDAQSMQCYVDDPESTGIGRWDAPLSKIIATVRALIMPSADVKEIADETRKEVAAR